MRAISPLIAFSAIPTVDQFGRVAQWHRLALGDRRSDLDATALHLEVGKCFCRLLALDDEGSAIDGLTPSRSLRKPFRPPGQLEPLRRPQYACLMPPFSGGGFQ
jgi:hypothetical protein